jgi:hypothetical protein
MVMLRTRSGGLWARYVISLSFVFVLHCWTAALRAQAPTVVINEIHYHPADDTNAGEFIELHNHGSADVPVDGWILAGGVQLFFPGGAVIPAGGYALVAADAATLIARYSLDPSLVVGSYTGNLSNGGELLLLYTEGGYLASFVDYGDSDLWPEEADGLGPSLERVSPLREETDAAAWALSIPAGGTPGAENSVFVADPGGPVGGDTVDLVAVGEEWRYFKGTEEPPATWNELGFADGAWELGPAGLGYGDGDDATELLDMQGGLQNGGYQTVYIRKTFQVTDPAEFDELRLLLSYDDGFVAYLNGVEIARNLVDSTAYNAFSLTDHEAGTFEVFPIPSPATALDAGTNVLAIQGHNATPQSSDFSLHPALEAFIMDDVDPPPGGAWVRPPRDLVVNELAAAAPGTGWVELYNPTAAPVDASGRRLALFPDSAGSHVLSAGSVVPARGRLVIGEGALGFELEGIHALLLLTADGRYIDGLNPRATTASQSTGRFPDGDDNRVVFTAPTRNAANTFSPETRIVINEVMYHPLDANPGTEFVEIRNRSVSPVSLTGWQFTRGITYAFPAGTMLGAGAYLVIAGDPAAVQAHYGIAGVLGPYTGRIKNDAELIVLRDALGNVADQVRIADEETWPEDADGTGPSVELIHPDLENRYGPAWLASNADGTPGAANSRLTGDPPPIVVGVRHSPVIPTPSESVRVLATASDTSGIALATLFWQVDGAGGAPSQVAMADDGAADDGVAGNGVWGAAIPAQAARAIVAFWIRAQAADGEQVTVPAGAPTPAFLYQVENPAPEAARPRYRFVLRAADLNLLRNRGVFSDELLDCTFVADGRAWYNRGVRYRGQSARSCNPLSYRVQFSHDHDFHGIKRLNLNGCNPQRQWIGLDFLSRTGIPAPAAWFRQLVLNGQPETAWHLRVEATDDQFLERSFPGDDDGNLYRGENQANLDYRGTDFDAYRNDYLKETNEELDDFSDVVDLSFLFDSGTTSDADFRANVEGQVDANEWALYFAVYALLGSTENSIVLNNGDDYFLYHRFSDDRWMLLPWDLDSVFTDSAQALFRPTVDAIERFLEDPLFAPLYWCHVEFLLESTFEDELVDSRIDHLVPLFGAQQVQDLRTYADQRRSYIEQEIRPSLTIDQVNGGTVQGGILDAAVNSVTLGGFAPGCGTSEVRFNGAAVSYDAVDARWDGTINVQGVPTLEIAAVTRDGSVIERIVLAVRRAGQSDVATPQVSPAGGWFSEAVAVTLSTQTPSADIYYTLDGSPPTTQSALYTGPFMVGTTMSVRARAYRTGFNPSPIASADFRVGMLRDPDPPVAVLGGLRYEYFEGNWSAIPSFSGLVPRATGSVPDFTLDMRLRQDNFAVRFTGFLEVAVSGIYTFYTTSNDGSRLYIGSELVVDNDVPGDSERSGQYGLSAGRHAITVTYYEGTGSQSLAVSWESALLPREPLPAAGLFRPANLPPLANAGLDLTARPGMLVQLDGSASSDPDTAPGLLTFQWTQTGGPAVVIENASSPVARFLAASSGDYIFRLAVGDGASTATDDVRVSVVRAGLIAHWRLDEASGSTALDSAGTSPGALVGGAAWRPAGGRIFGALEFDGNDDRVELGDLDVTDGTGIAIAFWFRADDFDQGFARFVSKATGFNEQEHYWMVSTVGGEGGGGALRFRLRAGGSTTTLASQGGVITAGRWYHAAATYDGSRMRIYRDGQLVAEGPKTGTVNVNPEVPAALGNQPLGAGDAPFDGLLDDVRIYNRALSLEEVEALASGEALTPFIRGDADGDGSLDMGDAVLTLFALAGETQLGCLRAADLNDDGAFEVTDVIHTLNFLFLSGPPPRAPFPSCGPDPTFEDGLPCDTYALCDPASRLVELIPPGAEWRFFRGSAEPPANWRDLGFSDASWERGPAGFGYGDFDDATEILDMEGSYLELYIRTTFQMEDRTEIERLQLTVNYDDAFVAYLNGVEVARGNFPIAFTHEAGVPETFDITDLTPLRDGTNVLAIEGYNSDLGSSDFSLAPSLDGVRRGP